MAALHPAIPRYGPRLGVPLARPLAFIMAENRRRRVRPIDSPTLEEEVQSPGPSEEEKHEHLSPSDGLAKGGVETVGPGQNDQSWRWDTVGGSVADRREEI